MSPKPVTCGRSAEVALWQWRPAADRCKGGSARCTAITTLLEKPRRAPMPARSPARWSLQPRAPPPINRGSEGAHDIFTARPSLPKPRKQGTGAYSWREPKRSCRERRKRIQTASQRGAHECSIAGEVFMKTYGCPGRNSQLYGHWKIRAVISCGSILAKTLVDERRNRPRTVRVVGQRKAGLQRNMLRSIGANHTMGLG